MMISFLGVRTDRQTRFWNPHMETCRHKKFQLKAQNLWLAVDPYMPPRRSGMHTYLAYICMHRLECPVATHPQYLVVKLALSHPLGTKNLPIRQCEIKNYNIPV